jgi:hypothetical protein
MKEYKTDQKAVRWAGKKMNGLVVNKKLTYQAFDFHRVEEIKSKSKDKKILSTH